MIAEITYQRKHIQNPVKATLTHSFPMHPFSTPLKSSENLTVFWGFEGVEKGYIGKEWVNEIMLLVANYFLNEASC